MTDETPEFGSKPDEERVSDHQTNTSASDDQSEAPDKRKWRLIALAVLLVGIGIAAALYMLRPQQKGEEPPDRPPLVSTQPVALESGPIVVTGQGTVQPTRELGISLQVSGRVVYLNPALTEGGRVRRGEPLVRVEPDDFRNRAAQAQAEVERARVDLAQAIEQRETAREEFERLRDRIADRRTDGEDGSAIEADFVRPGEEAGTTGNEADLPIEPSPLALGEPQVQAAQAALNGAQARLRNAQLGVERTTVTAPFDAIVRSADVERGQFVSAGEQLARLYSAQSVEIPVPLGQEKAALIPNLFALDAGSRGGGSPARVSVDYGGKTYTWDGVVDRAEGSIDQQTRTVNAIVRVAQPRTGGRASEEDADDADAPPLLPGFFARVEITGRTPGRYFSIPDDAIRDGSQVWAVRDGRIAFVPVTVIARDGSRTFVSSPAMRESERIVTGELASVAEGREVRTGRGNRNPAIEARQTGGTQPRYDSENAR